MKPTDITDPNYFHKVVDCQWACPAHTPVPEYIRMIAAGRYSDAYLLNWHSNVFPGILGRTCDRPCEPACRRARVEHEPVAVCRLKRVAADLKDDVHALLSKAAKPNGKRIAIVGAGPASLTAARDLALVGYHCEIFDENAKAGGMIRSRIPNFRLPEKVIDEECAYILDLGIQFHAGKKIGSLKKLLSEDYDAIFIATGAPRGLDLDIPGRNEPGLHIHVGLDWLASVRFDHIHKIGENVLVLGGGNTAMDCARTARRLGGKNVKVIVRSAYQEMKASPWERSEATREGIEILNLLVPKEFKHVNENLAGVVFQHVKTLKDATGRRLLEPTGETDKYIPCDGVLIAVGQEVAFPWIERDCIEFDASDRPKLDSETLCSSHPKVFFGGDAASGAKNIVSAVASGHEAAISIDLFCRGENPSVRPQPEFSLAIRGRSDGGTTQVFNPSLASRFNVRVEKSEITLANLSAEVELGFDVEMALAEAKRCLNCDLETVFSPSLCIECRACVEICPTRCITFTKDGDEDDLRTRLNASASNMEQTLYIADGLQSGRVMVKNEDICLHCGYCADHCPTGAWDMQNFFLQSAQAEDGKCSNKWARQP